MKRGRGSEGRRSAGPDFKKLVAELGYVRARRVLRERERSSRQAAMEEEDAKAVQQQLSRRLHEAIRISATLGEPSFASPPRPPGSVKRSEVKEANDSDRRRFTAEHALSRGMRGTERAFLAPQLQLDSLPSGFGDTLFLQLGDLEQMNVHRNELVSLLNLSLPQLSMHQLRHLRLLNLSGNRLTSLPSETGVLSRLRRLDVSSNNLSKLPPTFSHLSSLETLHLGDNNFSTLDERFANLTQLQSLNLSKNLFSSLPYALRNLVMLRSLDISANALSHLAFLPPCLQPADLWVVDTQANSRKMYRNIITQELVENTSDYSDLAIREMGCLHVFQPQQSKYYHLRKTWLSICQVPEWEAVVDAGTGWTYFQNNVSGESTWELPDGLDLIGRLSNLESLNLSHNGVRSLPSSIVKLHNLSRLDITHNRLKLLCRGFDGLRKLTTLHLQFNELKSLPVSIERCHHLVEIDIQGNSLTKLPDGIGFLQNLQKLIATSNQISRIPYSLGYSKSLMEIFVENNPLTDPPIEIVSRPISEVKWVLRQKLLIEQRGLPPAMRVHRVGIQEEVVIDDKEWKDMMKMQLDIAVRHNALNFIAANN